MDGRMLTGVLFCAMMMFVSSSPIENSEPGFPMTESDLGLHLITVTPERIEGEYHDEMGGIYFDIKAREDFFFIDVTTLDGDPILTCKRPSTSNTVTFVSLLEMAFVMLTNSSGGNFSVASYFVPTEYQQQIEEAILYHNNFTEDMLQYLNKDNVDEKESAAVKLLVLRPETEFMQTVAISLQNSQEVGSDNLAALMFYDLVLQLKLAKIQLHEDGTVIRTVPKHLQKRCTKCRRSGSFLWGLFRWDYEECC